MKKKLRDIVPLDEGKIKKALVRVALASSIGLTGMSPPNFPPDNEDWGSRLAKNLRKRSMERSGGLLKKIPDSKWRPWDKDQMIGRPRTRTRKVNPGGNIVKRDGTEIKKAPTK